MTSDNLYNIEREVLIKHYEDVIASSKEKIQELQRAIIDAENRIKTLSSPGDIFNSERSKNEEYSTAWPLAKKVEYVLLKNGLISTTTHLSLYINEEEGFVRTQSELAKLVSNLAATLKQKIDKGVTFERVEWHGEWHYGLKKWFQPDLYDGSPEPKDAYKRALEKPLVQKIKPNG